MEVDAAVNDLLASTFGVVPSTLYRCCRVGLACALYCWDDSRRNFPPGAAIESTYYFRSSAAAILRKHAVVMMPWDGDDSYFEKVTGIPPHVVQLSQGEILKKKIDDVAPAVEKIVKTQLDCRAYGGTLSEGRVKEIVRQSVETAVQHSIQPMCDTLNTYIEARGGLRTNGFEEHGGDPTMARYGGMKYFKGKSRRVRETFRFPDSHGSNLYQQWFIGSEPLQTPPLCMLEHDDVDFIVRGGKTLNDMRLFVRLISDEAKRKGLYVDNPTPQECIHIYNACSNVFLISDTTAKGRNRNMAALKWTSMLRLRSDVLKRSREANGIDTQIRRTRRSPNPESVMERRHGLVEGNTQRQRNNNGIRGGRRNPTRRTAGRRPLTPAGDDFAGAFGHIAIPPGALEIDPEEIARIQQEEAEAEQQGRETAADTDGNRLHVGRGALGAPSARNQGFIQHLAESIEQAEV